MPASALHPRRPYAALIWVIRGTGAIIAILSILLLALGLVLAITNALHNPQASGWVIALSILVPVIVCGFLFLLGYSMYQNVGQTTLSYFIFIFSVLVAITFYQFLPLHLPQNVTEYVGGHVPFLAHGNRLGIVYRVIFAAITFFIFYAMMEEFLLRVIEFKTPTRR